MKNALGRGLGVVLAATAALAHAEEPVQQTRVAWLTSCPSDPQEVLDAQANRSALLGALVTAIGAKVIDGAVDSAASALKAAGETKTGGRRKAGVIADAVEAILAAVYLDGGLEAARAVFDRAWADELKAPPSRAVTNPKSALQEWAQGQGRPLPTYRVSDRTGSDHAPTFTVEVSVQGVEPLTAQGRSRQEAEKSAATALLKREGVI